MLVMMYFIIAKTNLKHTVILQTPHKLDKKWGVQEVEAISGVYEQ